MKHRKANDVPIIDTLTVTDDILRKKGAKKKR